MSDQAKASKQMLDEWLANNITSRPTERQAAEDIVNYYNQKLGQPFYTRADASTLFRLGQAQKAAQATLNAMQAFGLEGITAADVDQRNRRMLPIASTSQSRGFGNAAREMLYFEPTAVENELLRAGLPKRSGPPGPRMRFKPGESNLLASIIYGDQRDMAEVKGAIPESWTGVRSAAKELMVDQVFNRIVDRSADRGRDPLTGQPTGRTVGLGRMLADDDRPTVIRAEWAPAGLIPNQSVNTTQPLAKNKQTQYIDDLGQTLARKSVPVTLNPSQHWSVGDAYVNGWVAKPDQGVGWHAAIPITELDWRAMRDLKPDAPDMPESFDPKKDKVGIKQLIAVDPLTGNQLIDPLRAQSFRSADGSWRSFFGDPLVDTETIAQAFPQQYQEYAQEIAAEQARKQAYEEKAGPGTYEKMLSNPDKLENFGFYPDTGPLYQRSDVVLQALNNLGVADTISYDQSNELFQTMSENPTFDRPQRESQKTQAQINALKEAQLENKGHQESIKAMLDDLKSGKTIAPGATAPLYKKLSALKDEAKALRSQSNDLWEQKTAQLWDEYIGTADPAAVIRNAKTGDVLLERAPDRKALSKLGPEVNLFSEADIVPPRDVLSRSLPSSEQYRQALLDMDKEVIGQLMNEAEADTLDKGSVIARVLDVNRNGPSDVTFTPFIADELGRVQHRVVGGVNLPRHSPRQTKAIMADPESRYYSLTPDELSVAHDLGLSTEQPIFQKGGFGIVQQAIDDYRRPFARLARDEAGNPIRDDKGEFVQLSGEGNELLGPSSRLTRPGEIVAKVRAASEPVLGVLGRGLYSTPTGSSGLYSPMPKKPGYEPQMEFTIEAPQLQRNLLVDPFVDRKPSLAGGLSSRASIQAAVTNAIQEEMARREGSALEPIRDRTGALIAPPIKVFSPEAFAARREKAQTIKRLFS